MITILQLSSNKKVYLDGASLSQDEALDIARELVRLWGCVHPRARAKVLIEVEPKVCSVCNHYDTLEEGLEHEGYDA